MNAEGPIVLERRVAYRRFRDRLLWGVRYAFVVAERRKYLLGI
jgi:hypothetical protein